MRKSWIAILIVGIAALLVVNLQSPSTAQRRGGRGSGTRKLTQKEFQVAFWSYLTKSRSAYKNWAPFPGKGADIYEGQSPHGAYLRMYANGIAAGDSKKLPNGSIIVKENYGKDKKTLMAVTVMYRTTGYDPVHNDWYWIKYNPDGTTARTPKDKGNKPIAGRFMSCINCHDGADGKDFAFANDK